MKFTQDFTEAADKFFAALKKLDGTAPLEVKANSTATVETPTAPIDEVKAEPTKEVIPVVDTKPENDPIAQLEKKVEALVAEMTSVKANLNSTIGINTDLIEKLATILKAPAEGNITKVENSRPAEVKNDFKAWDDVINARLNHKSKI